MKLILGLASACAIFSLRAAEPRETLETFSGALQGSFVRSSQIDYDVSLEDQQFIVHVPENYDISRKFGLIVYFSSLEPRSSPKKWSAVLKEKQLLLVIPKKAINSMESAPRLGLGVASALKMMERFSIDPNRIYSAGLSGGARIAGMLGFYQSDIFKGTIQSCGADFPLPVQRVRSALLERDKGQTYGLMHSSESEYEAAKKNVRFVIATGPGDFRYANLLDLYDGGFAKHNFSALLIDDPEMKHEVCSAASLLKALAFIESHTSPTPK